MKEFAVSLCGFLIFLQAQAQSIRYFTVGESNRVACTVFQPQGSGATKPTGMIIHLYGHGGSHLLYNLMRAPYAELRQMLLERGYWILVPDLGEKHWMNNGAVTTLDAIITEMETTEGIDPKRVSLIGTSMGAGSALIYVGQRPNKIRTVCAIFPMTDFNAWMDEAPNYTASIANAYGCDPATVRTIFASRSPIVNLDAFVHTPVYLLHGDQDTIVPPHHSRDFAAALRSRGFSVINHEVPGFGHDDNIAEAYQKEIADFLTVKGFLIKLSCLSESE